MEETLSWNRALALTTACSLRIRGTESYSDHLSKSSSFSPAFKGPHKQACFANCVTFSQVLLHKLSTAAKFLLTPNQLYTFLNQNSSQEILLFTIFCVSEKLSSLSTELNFIHPSELSSISAPVSLAHHHAPGLILRSGTWQRLKK